MRTRFCVISALQVSPPAPSTPGNHFWYVNSKALPHYCINIPVNDCTDLLRPFRHGPLQALQVPYTLLVSQKAVDDKWNDDFPPTRGSEFKYCSGYLLLKLKRQIAPTNGAKVIFLPLEVHQKVVKESGHFGLQLGKSG